MNRLENNRTPTPSSLPTSPATATPRSAPLAPPQSPAEPPPLPPTVDPGARPVASSPRSSGPSSLLSVRAGAPRAVTREGALDPLRAPGPTVFEGPWRLRPEKLAARYGQMTSDADFGLVRVKLAPGFEYTVRDNQFALGRGRVGLRLLPVRDRPAEGAHRRRHGSEVADAYLREVQQIPAEGARHETALYASIVFWHPEVHTVQGMKGLADDLFPQHRDTHRGAYLGAGETTNAPREYHDRTWGVEGDDGPEGPGYPAHVFSVSLAGVPQGLYNWQGQVVDRVLNRDVRFPGDYKNDIYRTTDLNTALMQYRDSILGAPHLDEQSWFQYCAEHKELVEIVRANVPHNPAAFAEIFGDDPLTGGAAVWRALTREGGVFEEAFGEPWREAFETHFEPLWKKEGLTPAQIRPWKGVDEWQAYQNARLGGLAAREAHAAAGGFVPLKDGQAMLYRSESTSDLLHDFVATYASFRDVGGVRAAMAVMAFKDRAIERLRLNEGDPSRGTNVFFGHALPIAQALIAHEALVARKNGQPITAWKQAVEAELFAALSAGAPAEAHAGIRGLVGSMMAQVDPAAIESSAGLSRDEAHRALVAVLGPQLEAARDALPGNEQAIERNGPPALITRAVQSPDRHPTNPHVKIEYLFTAVHRGDLHSIE